MDVEVLILNQFITNYMKRTFLYLFVVLNMIVASAQTSINTRNQQCLNGWWDFQPVFNRRREKLQRTQKPAATRLDQRRNPGAWLVEEIICRHAKLPHWFGTSGLPPPVSTFRHTGTTLIQHGTDVHSPFRRSTPKAITF